MGSFTESFVEQATLAWLGRAGWSVRSGAEIAPGEPAAEREEYHKLFLEARLRDALLPKLISGELRVKDAGRFVGEVA